MELQHDKQSLIEEHPIFEKKSFFGEIREKSRVISLKSTFSLLGMIILIAGLGAGLYLSQHQQNTQQQASGCTPGTYNECETGGANACSAKYGSGIKGHITIVSKTSTCSYTCLDQGNYKCNLPYWGSCGGNGTYRCWAGLPGSKPPVASTQYDAQPLKYGDKSACGVQAIQNNIAKDADLYCVCGVGGGGACPTPTLTPSVTTSVTPTATPSATPSGTPMVGDLNNDGKVDILDYNLFMGCFGKTPTGSCTSSDINQDGVIDGIDYNILLRAMITNP